MFPKSRPVHRRHACHAATARPSQSAQPQVMGDPARVRLEAWGTSHPSYDKAVNTPPSPPLLCREQGLEEQTC